MYEITLFAVGQKRRLFLPIYLRGRSETAFGISLRPCLGVCFV